MNLCIIQSSTSSLTETFIQSHIELIPANVTAVHGKPAHIADDAVLSDSVASRISRFIRRNRGPISDHEIAYEKVLRRTESDAVLAEYGPSGVDVMRVCQRLDIPLIVHFHGYDACRNDMLQKHAESYSILFDQACAIVAVSRGMREQLISLGAPAEKVFYNPCGVDCDAFEKTDPSSSAPVFLAVGRFVQKKAPHLTVLSFAKVRRECPDARLRMIGDGPLLGVCRDLAAALKVEDSIRFLGAQPHYVVRDELLRARAFVQHSVIADDGDSEGTPVSILEAGASGLPVASTFHAGIPQVVLHEETGLLVAERDVDGMAAHMIRLLTYPELATTLGAAARSRIEKYFGMERSIGRLFAIIESCVEDRERPPLDYFSDKKDAGRAIRSPA